MSRKNVFAICAMLFIVGMVSLRLWTGGQLQAMHAVIWVEEAPDGRVHVVYGDRLFIENPDGTSQRVVPLAELGIQTFHGDLAALSDGSVILARGRMPELGAAEAMHATAGTATPDNTPSDTLMRCALDTLKCTQLDGHGTPARLGRTFMLAVDEDAQRIVVTDTSRHRVLLLDFEGRVLARDMQSFRFPNQVQRIAPGEVVIADSWHNRLVTVSYDGDRLGEPVVYATTDCWPGSSVRAQPTGFQLLPDGSRWAVAGLDLSFRAGLYRLEGDCATPIDTDLNPDLLYLSASGDAVLVPDAEDIRIWRFDAYGTPLADFGSPELAAAFETARDRKAWLTIVFEYSLWILLAGAIPMIIIGRRIDAEEKARAARGDLLAEAPARGAIVPPPRPAPPAAVVEPASQLRTLRHESVFRPRLLPIDTRWATLFYASVLLMLAAGVAYAALQPQSHFVVPVLGSVNLLSAAVAVVIATAAVVWLTLRAERLVIDSLGVHYTPPPYAPSRAWSLRWDEVAKVELRNIRSGVAAEHWFYVFTDKRGTSRVTPALYWRLAGSHDAGTQIVAADAGIHRAAIRRTALFGALDIDGAAAASVAPVSARDDRVIELVLIPPRFPKALRRRMALSVGLVLFYIAVYVLLRIDFSSPQDFAAVIDRVQAKFAENPWPLTLILCAALMAPLVYMGLKRARLRISADAIEFDSGSPIRLPFTHWRVPRSSLQTIELVTTSPRLPAAYRLRLRAGAKNWNVPPFQWFRLDRDIETQPLPPTRLFYFRVARVREMALACPVMSALEDAGYVVDDLTGARDRVEVV